MLVTCGHMSICKANKLKKEWTDMKVWTEQKIKKVGVTEYWMFNLLVDLPFLTLWNNVDRVVTVLVHGLEPGTWKWIISALFPSCLFHGHMRYYIFLYIWLDFFQLFVAVICRSEENMFLGFCKMTVSLSNNFSNSSTEWFVVST